MSNKSVVQEIYAAYVAAHKQAPTRDKAIKHFCDFAETWLGDRGIVGLAQHSDGMALRFNDGQEAVLFTAATAPAADQFFSAVNVTGTTGGVRNAGAVKDSSIGITG